MVGRTLMRRKGCIGGRMVEGQSQTQCMRDWRSGLYQATCMSGQDWLASYRMEA